MVVTPPSSTISIRAALSPNKSNIWRFRGGAYVFAVHINIYIIFIIYLSVLICCSSVVWSSYHKSMLASSDYEGTVTLWDALTGSRTRVFQVRCYVFYVLLYHSCTKITFSSFISFLLLYHIP